MKNFIFGCFDSFLGILVDGNAVCYDATVGISKQNVEKKSCGIMKDLLENQGLCHIVRNISSFLDPKSLAQCRLVSHSWKDLIDNDRKWLIFQLEHILNQEKIFYVLSMWDRNGLSLKKFQKDKI